MSYYMSRQHNVAHRGTVAGFMPTYITDKRFGGRISHITRGKEAFPVTDQCAQHDTVLTKHLF